MKRAVQGVKERMEFELSAGRTSAAHTLHLPPTTRRRKGRSFGLKRDASAYSDPGPAFLPSEHEELPPGVAFMVCLTNSHVQRTEY